MKISFGADERPPVVEFILHELEKRNHDVALYLPKTGETSQWSQTALNVAEDVAKGRVAEGILLCWTGTGMAIAANKIPGVRAALCDDAETAKGARLWNDANILCLSIRTLSEASVKEILDSWFATSYIANPNADDCLSIIKVIEEKYSKNK